MTLGNIELTQTEIAQKDQAFREEAISLLKKAEDIKQDQLGQAIAMAKVSLNSINKIQFKTEDDWQRTISILKMLTEYYCNDERYSYIGEADYYYQLAVTIVNQNTSNKSDTDWWFLAECLYDIGINYARGENYDQANKYLKLALEKYNNIRDKDEIDWHNIMQTLHLLCKYCSELENFTDANSYCQQAVATFENAINCKTEQEWRACIESLYLAGVACCKSKDYLSANSHFEKILDYYFKIANKTTKDYHEIAKIYRWLASLVSDFSALKNVFELFAAAFTNSNSCPSNEFWKLCFTTLQYPNSFENYNEIRQLLIKFMKLFAEAVNSKKLHNALVEEVTNNMEQFNKNLELLIGKYSNLTKQLSTHPTVAVAITTMVTGFDARLEEIEKQLEIHIKRKREEENNNNNNNIEPDIGTSIKPQRTADTSFTPKLFFK